MEWFGHATNYDYLKPWINGLWNYSQQRSIQLTLITNPDDLSKNALNEGTIKQLNAQTQPKLLFKLRPWSVEGLRENLEHADLVFIPSDPTDPRKNGASSNRLAMALWSERFVIASPVNSYRQFGDYCWLGDNLIEGIEWAVTHTDEVVKRLRAALPVVESALSPRVIGGSWHALFLDLLSGSVCNQENPAIA